MATRFAKFLKNKQARNDAENSLLSNWGTSLTSALSNFSARNSIFEPGYKTYRLATENQLQRGYCINYMNNNNQLVSN